MKKEFKSRIKKINRGFQEIYTYIQAREKRMLSDKKLHITNIELKYIVAIYDLMNPTLSELVPVIGVTISTISNRIKNLAKKGFVKISENHTDTRKKHITLTKKGFDAYTAHKQIHKKISVEYRELLTQEEVDQLVNIYKKIKIHIKNRDKK